MPPPNPPKTVLVTGANGYIGHAVALAFVRAGWTTYGLVRNPSYLPSLRAAEIHPLLGSPSSPTFLPKLEKEGVTFDVLVSTTEQILDYFPHYNDVVALLRTLATQSLKAKGVKPLVLFTSGCKDYGMSPYLANSPELAPQTELTALNPPPFAVDRAAGTLRIFDHGDVFDAVALRPTNVYGGSSSYYGGFFAAAEEGAKKGVLEVSERKETVLHAMHVDDCAEAYVALAEQAREVVSGQSYNISAWKYETLEEIVEALLKEYGIKGGARYVRVEEGLKGPDVDPRRMLMGFSQWVGSEKLRKDTGWTDRRLLFSQGIRQYRIAYEEVMKKGHPSLQNLPVSAE